MESVRAVPVYVDDDCAVPELTPGAARALLRILLKEADRRGIEVEQLDEAWEGRRLAS